MARITDNASHPEERDEIRALREQLAGISLAGVPDSMDASRYAVSSVDASNTPTLVGAQIGGNSGTITPPTPKVQGANSVQVTQSGNLATVSLVNDSASPAHGALYGASTAGVLGYQAVSSLVLAGANITISVNADGSITINSSGGSGGGFIGGINTQTTTPYTLALSDAGKMIDMNVAKGGVILPTHASVAFTAATSIQIGCRTAIPTIALADPSITIINATVTSAATAGFAGLLNIASDLWYLWGCATIKYVYRALILSYSPVAYWTFDSVLTSLVGSFTWTFQSGTALTYVSPLITTGNAASMTAAYYSIPYNASFTTLPFSVVIWVKFTTSSNTVLFECNADTGFSIQTYGGSLIMGLGGTSNLITSAVINDGNAHCVVFSCTSTQQHVYTDGVLSNTYTVTRSPSFGSASLYLGSRAGSFPFSGTMDELAYIPSALALADAQSIYASGT